jgi:hypothetical protein
MIFLCQKVHSENGKYDSRGDKDGKKNTGRKTYDGYDEKRERKARGNEEKTEGESRTEVCDWADVPSMRSVRNSGSFT